MRAQYVNIRSRNSPCLPAFVSCREETGCSLQSAPSELLVLAATKNDKTFFEENKLGIKDNKNFIKPTDFSWHHTRSVNPFYHKSCKVVRVA